MAIIFPLYNVKNMDLSNLMEMLLKIFILVLTEYLNYKVHHHLLVISLKMAYIPNYSTRFMIPVQTLMVV